MKKLLAVLLFLITAIPSTFAQDTCSLRITLLTCAPGEELYSTFGHTALRVQDRTSGTDYVYNYGTFEFGPDFYTEFIRGKLLYFLSIENFDDFLYQYQYESRSIQEQELKIGCDEKQKLVNALQVNAQPKNRYYRYDFLFDNCTTRAKDIVKSNLDSALHFKNILPADKPSFRELLHTYLDNGEQPWSKLGIDILLGADLDQKTTNEQAMFLPDYLLKGFDSAVYKGKPLVGPAVTILEMPSPLRSSSLFRPAIIFSLLLVIVVALSFVRSPAIEKALTIFDFLFFLLMGLAGILLLFMWFGTDHVVCRNNFNLLWAFPPNVVMAFVVHKRNSRVRTYFRWLSWLSIALLVTWFFIPQDLNDALVPIVLLIILRSWVISKRSL